MPHARGTGIACPSCGRSMDNECSLAYCMSHSVPPKFSAKLFLKEHIVHDVVATNGTYETGYILLSAIAGDMSYAVKSNYALPTSLMRAERPVPLDALGIPKLEVAR